MGVYNRYLPGQEGYAPVGDDWKPAAGGREPSAVGGLEQLRKLLSGHLCRCTGYEGQLRGIRAYLDSRNG